MVEPLSAPVPIGEALRAALPADAEALKVRVIEHLRVVALRHLAGGTAAVEAAMARHGMAALPKPGECLGADPWWVWTGPTECLLLTSHGAVAEGMLQALAPGRETLACAVDRSAGDLVFDLQGRGVDGLVQRGVDASAVPQSVGQGRRTRWMDIGVVLLRVAPDRLLLVVGRMHGHYAAQWIGHAWQGAGHPTAGGR